MTRPVIQLNTNTSWGGGEVQILFLLRALRERDQSCMLFTHPDGRLLRVAREEGLDAHPLPHSALSGTPLGSRILSGILNEHAPAVLHAHDSVSTTLAIQCGRRMHVPAIMTRRVASPIRNNWFSRRKYSARNLAAIACISDTVREAMRNSCDYPPERLHLIRSACDAAALSQVKPLEEFNQAKHRVGGVGSLTPKKNWPLMIRTASVLKKRAQNIHWYLTGTGPDEAALRALVSEEGVEDCFHFLGFREDAARVTRSMDAYFFPSIMEGAGVSVFEAMAMDIPVVSADAPGTMETLDGSGWIVPRDEPEAAADAVMQALTDPEMREKNTMSARTLIETRNSIAAMATAYEELYQSLADG